MCPAQLIESARDGDLGYCPIPIPTITNEEDENELVKLSARLYRFDVAAREWKERGAGEIKLLHHEKNNSVRIVMRRDKTFKVCANHFITPDMRMVSHLGCDRTYNWSTYADFADETFKSELLAVRFRTAASAHLWLCKFYQAIQIVIDGLLTGPTVQDDCVVCVATSSDEESSMTSDYTNTDVETDSDEAFPAQYRQILKKQP